MYCHLVLRRKFEKKIIKRKTEDKILRTENLIILMLAKIIMFIFLLEVLFTKDNLLKKEMIIPKSRL